jgi:hypothetical protein
MATTDFVGVNSSRRYKSQHCKKKGRGTNFVPRGLAFRHVILSLAQAMDLRRVIRL